MKNFFFKVFSPLCLVSLFLSCTSEEIENGTSSEESLQYDAISKVDRQNRNIYAIKKNNTGTNSTEVHLLNGNNNYKSFLLQTGTALHETGNNFTIKSGDYNGDGYIDLYAIKKSNTGTNSTEIHVLNGKNNFQSFLLQTGTVLHKTGSNFDFEIGDYNRDGHLDLYAIKKTNTGTNSTEIHVLNGKNKFQSFLLQTGTILHETGSNFDFEIGDYNRDGHLDLYAIKKTNTGTNSTEIHVLNGKNKFQSFLLQTGTILHETGSNFDFEIGDYNRDGHLDLYAIKKTNTGTKSTEIHVLNGENKFQKFILQTGTILHETGSNFEFN